MSALARIGYTALGIIILIPMLAAIFNFFSISAAVYLPYLGWGIALAVFYAFLPPRIGTMFE
jgi:threonine/homoserine/homoserine lactone efflux protein